MPWPSFCYASSHTTGNDKMRSQWPEIYNSLYSSSQDSTRKNYLNCWMGKRRLNILIWIQGKEMFWRQQNCVFLLPCKFFAIPHTLLVWETFRLVPVTFCTHTNCNPTTHIKIQGQTNTYNEIPIKLFSGWTASLTRNWGSHRMWIIQNYIQKLF